MPLSDEAAISLVLRFEGLRYFPQTVEARAELVKAMATAPTEADAESFVSRWLRSNVDAPRPADIYGAFEPPGAKEFTGFKEPSCSKCGDSTWEIVERGGRRYAQPCSCRKKKGAA